MPQWSWPFNGILTSRDPVALDYTGWRIIEQKRAEKGHPALRSVKREPAYIATAADRPAQARNQRPQPDRKSGDLTMDRRAFLKTATLPCLAACAAQRALAKPAANDAQFTIEARFYEKLPYKKIKCKLCPRECVIDDHERGYCGVRENRGGTYYSLVYSRVCAAHVDPIEKKPFFHFAPGTMAFSVATAGCNVNCKMCQNWEISQSRPEQVEAPISHPRTSPPWRGSTLLFHRLHLQRAGGLFRVRHGYRGGRPRCRREERRDQWRLHPGRAAETVVPPRGRHQSRPQSVFREVLQGSGQRRVKPVLDTLVAIRKLGIWNEIVYLVIPTLNDSDQEFKSLARWVKTELGPDVPLHFSQFHPEYLLKNLPLTPVATLERAKAICDAEGLHYVYIGNIPGHPAENTTAPSAVAWWWSAPASR